jgi:hypothetical protein
MKGPCREARAVSGLSIREYVRRSSQLTLLLTADPNDFRLSLEILGRAPPPPYERAVLAAIRFVRRAYGNAQRKIGTLSVLHPCRVASTVARCELANDRFSRGAFDPLDFLVALLHDVEEDIPKERLQAAEPEFAALLATLDEKQRWFMRERVTMLTRRPGQTYHDYLCLLIGLADHCVHPLRVKTADKLDSVLDLYLMAPSVSDLDFYLTMFEILCVPSYRGLPEMPEPPVSRKQIELFTSNLIKALFFVSLLRQTGAVQHDPVVKELSDLLIEGSIRQTEVILLSYLMDRIPVVADQRGAIKAGFEYCQDPEAVTSVTAPERGQLLDGTLLEDLSLEADDRTRKRHIASLYDDPVRFTALLFVIIAVFRCHSKDEGFYLRGITREGVRVL